MNYTQAVGQVAEEKKGQSACSEAQGDASIAMPDVNTEELIGRIRHHVLVNRRRVSIRNGISENLGIKVQLCA